MVLLRVRFTARLLLLHRGVFVCAHVTPAAAELNRKISKLETEQLELESRIEQQSQSYAALTDRLHAVVQENERKTKEIELSARIVGGEDGGHGTRSRAEQQLRDTLAVLIETGRLRRAL